MGRETLTLSTTGGHLWDRVHKSIAAALASLHGGPYRFQLGGGTTLAARWKHRDSFDLDLAVGRDVPLRDLAEPGNPFRKAMGDLGGRRRTTKGSGSSSSTLARSTSSN